MFSYNSLLPFGKAADGVLEITDSFQLTSQKAVRDACSIIYMLSSYTGETAPKIRFELTVKGQDEPLYISHSYFVGKGTEYTRNEWRIPYVCCCETEVAVNVEVPEGTSLYVRDFGVIEDFAVNNSGKLRHNAHLGFWGLAPDNTMPAFELAADCGFKSCIVVPKVTADGVLVCIHDDTINRTARDKNGCAPSEDIYVSGKTYSELSEWEYGSYKNEIYKGAKLPLLSDFFDLCVKTGMKPMFSTHPGLAVEKWREVREMLKTRGLLNCFHIKSFDIEILKTAFSVFGSDIDGYTYDISHWDDSKIDILKNSGIQDLRIGIEVRASECSEKITKAITDAGFFASVWDVKRRDFSEYERWISWGVTEFTEDFHCSMGLNY